MIRRPPAHLLAAAAGSLAVVAVGAFIGLKFMTPKPVLVLAPVAMAAETQRLAADESAAPLAAAPTPADDLVELARRDPMAIVEKCTQRYAEWVRDYRCTFLKQELLPGGMTPMQEISVLYRESPQSCFMTWEKNADKAKRALWMDAPAFVDRKGARIAKVEPAGAVARLLVADIMMPIHGKEARESSRRAIDEFGFRSILDLLTQINTKALERGVLDFRYEGTGVVDARPTLVFRRLLPSAKAGEYPDVRMVLHIDREWLVPVAVYSYADAAGEQLLGSYVMTNVQFNTGLTDEAFKF